MAGRRTVKRTIVGYTKLIKKLPPVTSTQTAVNMKVIEMH